MTVEEVLVAWCNETENFADDRRRRAVADWITRRLVGTHPDAIGIWWECIVTAAVDWARAGSEGLCPYLCVADMSEVLGQILSEGEQATQASREAAFERLKEVVRARARSWRLGSPGDVGAYVSALQEAQAECGLPPYDGFVWTEHPRGGYMRGGIVHPAILTGAEDLLPPDWHSRACAIREQDETRGWQEASQPVGVAPTAA